MRQCGSRLGWSKTRSRFVTKCQSTPLRTEDKQLHARADTTTKCELGCNPKQRVASHHNRKSSLTLLIRTLEGHKNCIGMRMTISHLPSSNSREHDLAPHVQQHIVVRAGNRMRSLAGLVWCWSLSCVYPFSKTDFNSRLDKLCDTRQDSNEGWSLCAHLRKLVQTNVRAQSDPNSRLGKCSAAWPHSHEG